MHVLTEDHVWSLFTSNGINTYVVQSGFQHQKLCCTVYFAWNTYIMLYFMVILIAGRVSPSPSQESLNSMSEMSESSEHGVGLFSVCYVSFFVFIII